MPRLLPRNQLQLNMLVGTHCHLDFSDFAGNLGEILARAKEVEVQQIVTIGIDLSSSERAIALAKANGEIYATVGIHPHNAKGFSAEDSQELLRLGSESQVVAYGEIGLDFYRNYQPRSVQVTCLKEQLDVARNCPLDRLLLETDAPFLAPVPKRGKRNEPAFLVYTAEKIASLKELPLEDVARQTTLNARRLFKLPTPEPLREGKD